MKEALLFVLGKERRTIHEVTRKQRAASCDFVDRLILANGNVLPKEPLNGIRRKVLGLRE
jgi:hypothetical protein